MSLSIIFSYCRDSVRVTNITMNEFKRFRDSINERERLPNMFGLNTDLALERGGRFRLRD